MALTIEDTSSGTSLPLWSAQEFRNERSAGLAASPITGFDSDTSFLTALEQEGRATVNGVVTGKRLSRDAAFSSDPETALAEWAVQFEAFVNGGQGDGYELSRTYRGDSFTGVIETAEWTRAGGAPLELQFNMAFIRGEGFGTENTVSSSSPTPGGNITLDGANLPNVREFQMEKSQTFEIYNRAFTDSPDENDLFSTEGAVRRVTVVGQADGDEATRNAFDDALTSTLGQDQIVSLHDPFTDRSFDGMIETYDATDEAGITRIGEYAVSFVEGQD